MNSPDCRHENNESARFCEACGAKLPRAIIDPALDVMMDAVHRYVSTQTPGENRIEN